MNYLANFFLGLFFIFSCLHLIYFVKPNAFFLTVDHNPLSRMVLFLYWLVYCFIFFSLLLWILLSGIDAYGTKLNWVFGFIGACAGLMCLFYGKKQKTNID